MLMLMVMMMIGDDVGGGGFIAFVCWQRSYFAFRVQVRRGKELAIPGKVGNSQVANCQQILVILQLPLSDDGVLVESRMLCSRPFSY